MAVKARHHLQEIVKSLLFMERISVIVGLLCGNDIFRPAVGIFEDNSDDILNLNGRLAISV